LKRERRLTRHRVAELVETLGGETPWSRPSSTDAVPGLTLIVVNV